MLGDDVDTHLVVGLVLISFVAGAGAGAAGQDHTTNNTVVINSTNTTNVTAEKVYKPTVSGYYRCTCGEGSYTKRKHKVWLNYCPICKRYNTLSWNPKGVDGGEYTCCVCDSDYCGQDGNNKDGGISGTRLIAA